MCLRFWTLASKEYRAGVEGGLLYPPENQYKTVTSFMIHLVLHRDASDGAYDRAIYIYVYHSKVAYRSYFVSKYHAEDFQQFAVLLPDGMLCCIDDSRGYVC
jgi:hypothetical protein